MNIVNILTLRNLQRNRRRTLVTIIGVIISVAMVTAVATLGISFMDLMQRMSIARDGEWHVLYKDINQEQLQAVKSDAQTETLIISRDRGYALLEGSQNRNKPYLFIKEYNTRGFEQFPIELTNGRLPQTNNEIVISEEIAQSAKVSCQIGDQLVLDIGERFIAEGKQALTQLTPLRRTGDGEIAEETLTNKTTHNYTIVGTIARPTWEPTWAPGYTIISYVDESMIGTNETVNALVVLNKVQRSLYNHARDLALQNNIAGVEFNNSLLRYYGVTEIESLHKTLYSLTAIIMAITVIGSVALIYNAFAISVAERSRYLGMFSSVGATRKQKRNSVFFEGAVIALISIPVGILCGLGGLTITFWFINPMIQGVFGASEEFTVVVTPMSILGAGVISLLTIFISTYWPAQRASDVSAIDAIRQSTDIKLTAKAAKASPLIRKLFGFEAEIGLKNLRRNKRRYQATVFSLVISIVLFLTVSFFTDNLKKSAELSQDGVNFDIQVILPGENPETDEELVQSIAGLNNVTEYSIVKDLTLHSRIDEKFIAKELQEQVREDNQMLENGKYSYYIDIHALDEKSLKGYTEMIGADYDQLRTSHELSGIVIDKISYQDYDARKYIETKAIQAEIGQKIELCRIDRDSSQETYLNELQVAALTDQTPMGVFPAGLGGLTVIVSEQVLDELAAQGLIADTRLLLKSTDPMATQHQIEELSESNLNVYNVYQARQQEEQIMLLISVFTYGFIVLITAICIANIFNTISTSIALRKREFAMLKSVGMTPRGFNKMLNYESIFYGIKSLLYGLPLSVMLMYLIYRSMMYSFSYGLVLPWTSIGYVIIIVFVIVGAAMLYSSSKVKQDNIIDALKQENI
jgi:putative ABC transport system permease protein